MAKQKVLLPKEIEQYTHSDKQRANNPQVGLVTPETDNGGEKQKYASDPQLNRAGKAGHTLFEVPAVSRPVVSLPFTIGDKKRVAVKIVDDP